MPFIYESADLLFSNDGDYFIDDKGDLEDTYVDPLLGLGQAIRDRLQYEAGAWSLYPSKGVLKKPFGMYNFEENMEAYESIIRSALTFDGLVMSEDLSVDIAPLNDDSWVVAIAVDMQPTPLNQGVGKRVFFMGFDQANKRIQYF